MLSKINALAGQLNANTENSSSNVQKTSGDEGTLYSLQQQMSASYQEKSGSNYTGIKLDLSNSVEMGVHGKTAQMVLETNVRLSIESTFQGVDPEADGESGSTPGLNPEATAKRMMDFAQKFMNGFLQGSEEGDGDNKSLADFIEEVKASIDEGFEKARGELAGENGELAGGIEDIFDEVKNYLEEYLKIFASNAEGDVAELAEGEAAEAVSESASNEIAEENVKAANSQSEIPETILERLGR